MPAENKKDYIRKRRKLSGILFETALPNEYLVEVGRQTVRPVLGGRRFRLFKKFLRIPGSVETLYFSTDNANVNYQGIGVEGYASWRIDPEHPEVQDYVPAGRDMFGNAVDWEKEIKADGFAGYVTVGMTFQV